MISFYIGIVAIIIFNLSLLQKEKNKILFFQIIANIFYAIQYLLLGVYTAPIMNGINISRSISDYIDDKHKKEHSIYKLLFFIIVCLGVGILMYENIYSIIPPLITSLYAIATYQKNMTTLRVIFMLTACLWIFYNLQVGAYSGLIGNFLEIICSIISIIKYRKKTI